MAKYAIVKNYVIENVIEAEESFAQTVGGILIPKNYGIGDRYENGQFIKVKRPIEITITWEEIRQQRNNLLRETDWTQLIDAPLTEEKIRLYRQYRQELRDLPQQYENPEDVIFPIIES